MNDQNQKGLSLVEMMITGSFLAVLAYIVIQYSDVSHKSMKTIDERRYIGLVNEFLRDELGDYEKCTTAFQIPGFSWQNLATLSLEIASPTYSAHLSLAFDRFFNLDNFKINGVAEKVFDNNLQNFRTQKVLLYQLSDPSLLNDAAKFPDNSSRVIPVYLDFFIEKNKASNSFYKEEKLTKEKMKMNVVFTKTAGVLSFDRCYLSGSSILSAAIELCFQMGGTFETGKCLFPEYGGNAGNFNTFVHPAGVGRKSFGAVLCELEKKTMEVELISTPDVHDAGVLMIPAYYAPANVYSKYCP